MEIQENASLKHFNTFGIDAKAAWFAEAQTRHDITEFIRNHFPELLKPLLILGGGSNILFAKDFVGTVLKISTKGIEVSEETGDHVLVKAEAGENWAQFVDHCVSKNWGGIENLTSIPGNVGSSPIQNIGAYGTEIENCFHSLEAMEIETCEQRTFLHDDCKFGYRNSVFKDELKSKYIILSVTFNLSKNPEPDLSYAALAAEIQRSGIAKPTIQEVAEIVKRIRQSKLPSPAEIGNAGSFFKNPVVSAFEYYRLKSLFPGIVSYNQYDGTFKLAAGWLIEQCGWKGHRQGDAGVHKDQALILVNYGNATGAQIIELADNIKDSVNEKFGVDLEPEVNII